MRQGILYSLPGREKRSNLLFLSSHYFLSLRSCLSLLRSGFLDSAFFGWHYVSPPFTIKNGLQNYCVTNYYKLCIPIIINSVDANQPS